jgi:hypothetical protein
MDAEIEKQLGIRLVKGEISKEEYLSIRHTLESHSPENEQSVSSPRGSSSILTRAKESVFGSSSTIVPSDNLPLVVDKNLSLYGKYLTHKNVQLSYAEIEGVSYSASSYTVNLVPISRSTILSIMCKGGRSICAGTTTTIFHGRIHKLVQSAYSYLRHVTFRQRMEKYLRLLEVQGYIDASDVRIFSNGDVQKGELRLNLKLARKNHAFGIGTRGGLPAQKLTNPNEVIVGETGTSILSKRIVFELGNDKDVISAILEWLSEADSK